MRHIKPIAICLTAISVVLLAGCAKENETRITGPAGEEVTVLMKLNVPGGRATRGLSGPQEKAVNNVDVFVFDKDLKLTDWQYGQLQNNSGDISFSAMLKASENSEDKFRLMVLANVRSVTQSIFAGANLGGHKGKPYADVRALLQVPVPSYSDLASQGIPMWGEIKDMVLVDDANDRYSMNLLRSLARIDVGTNPVPAFEQTGDNKGKITGWAALDNFSLEKVFIYNANSTYGIVPERESYDFATGHTDALSLPDSNTKYGAPLEYSDSKLAGTVTRTPGNTGVSVTANVYTGEADVKMGAGGKYADGNHADRMSIVVAGYYSPDPLMPNTSELSYYRLDFLNGIGEAALMDIMRNNNYQIVIRNVGGPGSETKEKAAETFNADITAVVNSWSDGNQGGTVVHNDHYLNVNPYDFKLDKWARTDEEITIDTNVPATGGTSWSAEVVKHENSDPDPAWLTITPGTETGSDGDILKFNLEQAPAAFTESDSRSARIRISAGSIKYDIIVTQTGRDSDHLLRLSHSELVFAGRKWDGQQWVDPDPQTITVRWGSRRWPYSLNLTDYTGGGVEMAAAIPSANNTPALTVAPAAVADDNSLLAKNPFFERSSRLAFTADNTDGTEHITKQVLVRQIYYSLVVSGTKDYYYLGKTYTFNIKSNSPWTATFGGDESVLASCSAASGNGNTLSGENMTFTIAPSATIGNKATVTFSSPDHLFPPQTFNIIAQNELPNCYVISSGLSKVIPISKVFRVWELDHDLCNDDNSSKLPEGTFGAKLLWQDGDIIELLSFYRADKKQDSVIIIRVKSNKRGNAVVAFTIDDKVYWSWHLWVTPNDPDNPAYQGTANGYTFMDRNLGALGTSGYNAFGLYYQGGRKDPFPPGNAVGSNDRKTIFDIDYSQLPYNQAGGITTVSAPPYEGLEASIQGPMNYLYGAYGSTHWYGLLYDATRTDLWENTVYKSDYDPCPEGWRVATEASLAGMFTLAQGVSSSGGFNWNGLYFPAQYHINYGNGDITGTTSSEFALWYTRTGNGTPMMMVNSTSERGSNSRQCNGAPVRCIKDV